jgi:hypothetical protein
MSLRPGQEKVSIATPGGTIQLGGPGSSPSANYEAARASRQELQQQLDNLQDKRSDLRQELQQDNLSGADRKGLEQRITDFDARIQSLDQQIAAADQVVARAAGVPGAIVPPPPPIERGPSESAVALGATFMIVVLLPLTIAYARRIWRRGAQVVAGLPKELAERFTRLEQAVDAIAVEVERIGEGQRFVTRVFSEERALGAGAAQPIETPARERAEVPR